MDLDSLVQRVVADFREFPGMRLTPRQAQRLWALDPRQYDRVLERLVADGFLRRHPNGTISRGTDTVAA